MNAPTAWAARHGQAIARIEPLVGLTACSQIVTFTDGSRLIWRTQTARATQLGINYRQEAALLNAVEPLNFAPRVRDQQDDESLLTWLKGQTPSHYSAPLLRQLAQQLAALHTFQWQQPGQNAHFFAPLDLAARCRFLWQGLPANKQAQFAAQLPTTAISPFARAICHHDLHLANFIQQGETLYLIDWEYAAVSDPALELALFFAGNPLSPEQQHDFLTNYLTASGFAELPFKQKMAEYAPQIALLNALWFEMV